MLRRIAIGLVLALLVALPATAQDYQKGLAAHRLGDYATALMEWRPLAAKGHARAQYKLALCSSSLLWACPGQLLLSPIRVFN